MSLQRPSFSSEARAQLTHLVDDLTHCPNPDDPTRRLIRPGAGLLFSNMVNAVISLLAAPQSVEPIDMILHCPNCGKQHIDEAKPCTMGMECGSAGVCYAAAMGEPNRCDAWANEPHRSHLCHGCGYIWRPADVATNGVKAIKTRGMDDHGPVPEGFRGLGLPGHAIAYMNQEVVLDPKSLASATAAVDAFDRELMKRRRGDVA